MHHRDLRNTGCGQQGLVGKGGAAVNEDVGLVQQVGATRFQQADDGQLLLHGNVLHAQAFAQTPGRDRAPLDGTVGGSHHGPHAAHIADTANAVAPGQRAIFVVMLLVTGQSGDFQKRCAAVEQQVDALARHQLATLVKSGFFLGLGGPHPTFDRTNLRQRPQHVIAVAPESLAKRVKLALYH